MFATSGDRAGWLAAATRNGVTTAEAQAVFDTLPPVSVPHLVGLWRGAGLPTGHPWDGMLEATGWYGKAFDSPEVVHPLLFSGPGGRAVPIEPRWMPVGLLVRWPIRPPRSAVLRGALRTMFATRRPAARVRALEFRGVVTAVMIYDRLPIMDVFRAIDERTVLGWMDLRGLEQPFFFVLSREADESCRIGSW